ncbi:probable LRR receptor-like serine/threonine-protein kinase At1g53430 [Euphorbia lathyris]|uniref:probable LRR receptor-like serine/threonine-protein kinase At1g53430 n=1 Tax=Euphorbia lathyris TaxID=212925 RepID=UPI003313D17D
MASAVVSKIFYVIAFEILIMQLGSLAQTLPLPPDEVEILRTISTKLNIKQWNVTETSCQKKEWNNSIVGTRIISNVTCGDCSAVACHVRTIQLKGFNLTGVVPPEFGNLSHLVEIDLSRNYLNGTIPTRLAQLPNLRILSFIGNRLNGSIPPEIGNISTLEDLILEDNLLGGPLPRNLGNLRNLKRILLSANNFTGTIPDTLGNLKNLTDFRIDGSILSGKIPDFIGNWTNLIRLDLQGTSMEGPIPANISLLTNLKELRISDLRGPSSKIPNLQAMANLELLVLRNCLINDSIPEYLGELSNLKTIDLTFNRLTGTIPSSLQSSEKLQYMFLTNNSLTGEVPGWILTNGNGNKRFDLSYNNFTGSVSGGCQRQNLNLASSFSSSASNEVSWCMKNGLTCSQKPEFHSLFINCGGRRVPFEDNEYHEDSSDGGPSSFVPSAEVWAYSSTGLYMNKDDVPFVARNNFNLNISGGDIYQTARLAPLSLKYYALCMRPAASYKVQLHFAEIMYTSNQSFTSLGRRIFDVSIQGNVVLKDYNIMEKAGGVGIGITEVFENVTIDGSTLEIHLYWAGKGTTAIPDRGVYGPLISAITITPNYEIDDGSGGLSAGGIIGIVAATCFVVMLILTALRMKGYLGGNKYEDNNAELRGLDLQTGYFTLRQIKRATNNFDPEFKIGEGGFGPVYKGVLSDGVVIAVKQLSSKSKQGNREFVNEIGMISALQHPNLVKLYGCCIEGNQLLLVYEYLENNSLARALFGPEEHRINLDWQRRKKIVLGIAKGLAYLHEESRLKIVHRDIKATNVLLDKDLNAKISDFGLAKLDEEENTHISTRIAGTIGYMAPEYAMRGYLTDKADVYSFGVVLLEIVSGKSNTNYRPKDEFVYLLDWAYVLQEQGNLLELVDPFLGSNYSKEEARRILTLALLCTNPSPTLRPSMSSVINMVEGKIPVQAPIIKRGSIDEEARFKAFEVLSQDSQTNYSNFSQESHAHQGGPWIDSSVSLPSKDEISDEHSEARLL